MDVMVLFELQLRQLNIVFELDITFSFTTDFLIVIFQTVMVLEPTFLDPLFLAPIFLAPIYLAKLLVLLFLLAILF